MRTLALAILFICSFSVCGEAADEERNGDQLPQTTAYNALPERQRDQLLADWRKFVAEKEVERDRANQAFKDAKNGQSKKDTLDKLEAAKKAVDKAKANVPPYVPVLPARPTRGMIGTLGEMRVYEILDSQTMLVDRQGAVLRVRGISSAGHPPGQKFSSSKLFIVSAEHNLGGSGLTKSVPSLDLFTIPKPKLGKAGRAGN